MDDIESPCINDCKIQINGFCRGCFRNIEEIINWKYYDNNQKEKVLENLKKRFSDKKSS